MKQSWIIIAIVVICVGGVAGFLIKKGNSGESHVSSEAAASIEKLVQEATAFEKEGDRLKAKEAYQQIVDNYPDYDNIEQVQGKLGELNVALIASNAALPQTVSYEVKPGDSLGKLSKQYGTTKELIKKSNNIKSDVIRVGQKLRIWSAPFSMFVDKSQNTLVLKSGNQLIKVYHVSTGANNSTPVGTFHIATKLVDPVWFKSGGQPIASKSPDNELGSRWMGFGEDPHYGIHGTIKPNLIGQQATAGCVRLANDQVEELYDMIPAGTEITITD